LSGDQEAASNAVQRALALNPSCAVALYLAAQIHSFVGRSRTAVEYANRALRLSPFDLLAYEAYLAQGQAAIQDCQYDAAALHYAKAVQNNPGNGTNHLMYAIALALVGRVGEAGAAVKRGSELEPRFRAGWFYSFMTRELADRLVEGARLLALPV
jgi:adenylate cyclase